ncbi:MAG: diguanylate cyclase [Ruthenibacterium sp.]
MDQRFKQFHHCFDTSPIAFFIVQAKGDLRGTISDFTFCYLNRAYADLCGVSIDALLGTGIGASANLTGSAHLALYAEVVQHGNVQTFVERNVAQGKYFHFLCYALGEGFCGVALMDVTDEMIVRDALARSDAQMQNLMDNVPGGIAIFKLGAQIETLYFNNGICRLSGYTREEYMALFAHDVSPAIFEEDRPRILAEVKACLRAHRALDLSLRICPKKGKPIWIRLSGVKIRDDSGAPVVHAVLMDISQEQRMVERLRERAERDDLTGLYNRAGFKEYLREFFEQSPDSTALFMMMHFDKFRQINEKYGHAKGDAIICAVADALTKNANRNYRVARIGGVDFALFLPQALITTATAAQLEELFSALKLDLPPDLSAICGTFTAGVCIYPQDGTDFDTLYDKADKALQTAKRVGSGCVRVYDDTMQVSSPVLMQNMEWLLDENSDAIYVCNADTYELLYINKPARAIAKLQNVDVLGMPCYHALMGFDAPCPFCSLDKLQHDTLYEREFYMQNTDTHLLLRGKLLDWNGVSAHVEFVRNDTRRALLAQQMQVEEERLRTAIAMTDISVWEYDIATKVVHQTAHSTRCSGGASVIENVPQTLIDTKHYHPDSEADALAIFDRILAGEKDVSADLRVWDDKDKLYWWERVHYTTIFDADGKPVKAIAVGKDVSEEKAAEEHYKNALLYNELAAPDTAVSFRINLTQNRIESCTVHDARTNDLRSYTVASDLFASILPRMSVDEDKEKVAHLLNRDTLLNEFSKGKDEFNLEYRREFGGDVNHWLSLNIRLFKHPKNGDILGFLYTYDIHVQKMAMLVVNAVVELDYDHIVCLNAKNNSYVMFAGAKDDKMLPARVCSDYEAEVAKFAEIYVLPEDVKMLVENMSLKTVIAALATQHTFEFTVRFIDSAAQIYRKRLQFSYLDKASERILISRTDITRLFEEEQKRADLVTQALAVAEQANRTKSLFLSSMSHDIRTPMNAIVGMTELAQLDPDNKETVHESLSVIAASADHLLHLINDVLDMSKLESGNMVFACEPLQLTTFTASLEQILSPMFRDKSQKFTIDYHSARHDYFYGDAVRLNRILINLLGNASKFTGVGGEIYLLIDELAGTPQTANMRFTVTDTGNGIAPEMLKAIFSPFVREGVASLNHVEGTGLGLSIVKSIVEAQGGHVKAESTIGQGSRFTVDLPMQLDNAATQPDVPALAPVEKSDFARVRGKHVLLVEDHPVNILVATRMFEKLGIVVDTAENGAIGYDKFIMSGEPGYDMIFMDIQMPVMNGYEATAAIRASAHPRAKSIPIIAMTANAFADDVAKALAAGMNDHLAKPISIDCVVRIVASLPATE